MLKASLSSMFYNPGDPGAIKNIDDVVRFLRDETVKIQTALRLVADGHLDPQPKPPARPRAGDIRMADGVNWNPGSGEGVYVYKSTGTWVFLG